MKHNLASALAPTTAFVLILLYTTGHIAVPPLSPLALWWCILTGCLGFVCLMLGPRIKGLSSLGSTLTQGIGLLGTVTGFMIMLQSYGADDLEAAGMWTALSTTFVGLGFSLILYLQDWLLGEAE